MKHKKHELTWDGVTLSKTINDEWAARRQRVIDAAKASQWKTLLDLVSENLNMANTWRPDGKTWFSPLHHAAYIGAPIEVVQALIQSGAWRTLRTAKGEQAVEIAQRRGHTHLIESLTPVYQNNIPKKTLEQIQAHFHEVILERSRELIVEHQLRLPQLDPLLEFNKAEAWFAVPGMYGGFKYWFQTGENILLWSESWCRIVGGSGERHIISEFGSLLVARGFV